MKIKITKIEETGLWSVTAGAAPTHFSIKKAGSKWLLLADGDCSEFSSLKRIREFLERQYA